MRRTKTLTALLAAATVAMVGFGATNANAAQTGDTIATFTVNGTGLSISVPATATLGSANTGALSVAGSAMGPVTVTDGRGLLVATWTASVSSTTFTTGTGTAANQKVTPANVTYTAGVATASSGAGL